jgi:acetate kinase
MSAVLVLNAGSSSLKYAVFSDGDPPVRQASTRLDLGSGWGATRSLALTIRRIAGIHPFDTVGHRIVHGGPRFFDPERVTPPMLEELRRISPFDPEHMPVQIALLEVCEEVFPGIPQVACFDTAFHRDLPRASRLLPIPRRYEAAGVRRYGFHGLSYAYIVRELGLGAGGRAVIAHLGNGASVAAVNQGKCIDTTMAFTPTAGIPMSRRSGDLDPGLVAYLARTEGMTPDQFHEMVNTASGLLGISETSADVRDLLKREADDPRAAEALEIFCYGVKKTIGAYAAALGGVDTLVFSGGIGENAAALRERICTGLGFLGIELDREANEGQKPLISRGRVAVRIVKTDEEVEIARSTLEVLGRGSRKGR